MPSPEEQPMDGRPKLTRRGHPKVRTGCLTCKTRHVKCDEAKPSCMRCIKLDLDCDGYPEPAKGNKNPVRSMPPLAILSESGGASARSLCRPPPRALFRNEQELRYFKVFSNETADQLSGPFETNLWSRLVLQGTELSTPIRNAVIAIGALDLNTWKVPAKSPEEKLRRQFAYHKYSMAIKDVRDRISEGRLCLTAKLISIILFVCFEIYHGNNISAVSQIRAGSFMIEERCREWNTNNGGSKPPPEIDGELLESFTELEIQASMHSGYVMNSKQRERLRCRQSIVESIPIEFPTLRQARTTLHLILMRHIHWNSERSGGVYKRGFMMPMIIYDNESHFEEKDYQERDRRLREFENWAIAFEPLLLRARSLSDTRLLISTTVMRITYLTCYLSTFATMLNFQQSYYNQTHLLAEIIALIKSLSGKDMKDNDMGFSITIHFLVPLSVVAWRYRHRALRREAIKLLLASPRREGLWDGVFIGKTARWVAGIEEEGLSSAEIYVPHDLATNVEVADVDVLTRTATLKAILKDKTSGEKIMKETKIGW